MPDIQRADRHRQVAKADFPAQRPSGAASPKERGDRDDALASQNQMRNVLLTLPHWSVAASVIPGTDLLLTAARRSLVTHHAEGLCMTDDLLPCRRKPLQWDGTLDGMNIQGQARTLDANYSH